MSSLIIYIVIVKYTKRLYYTLQWKYRNIMLPRRGVCVEQTKDMFGVMYKGEYVPYGKEYYKLYFKGYIK